MQNLFYIVAIGVFVLMHLVIYFLFFKKLTPCLYKQRILALLVCLNFLAVMVYFLGRYLFYLPPKFSAWLSLGVGFCFILCVVACFYQCLCVLNRLDLKRRESFQKGINLLSGALAGGYIGWGLIEGAMKPRIEKISLPLKGLKQDFSAIQISDLHIGGLIDAQKVSLIVDQALLLKPDVIFLTGDIVDTKITEVQDALKELKRLKAPLGVYYVLGNHEYFHGVYEILQSMRDLGFEVLENQGIVLKKGGDSLLNIIGVNDLFGRKLGILEPDLNKALSQRDESLPSILLAHQPKFIFEVLPSSKIDLMLSGHTHGGQIFPFGLFVRLDQPYLAGLYEHTAQMKIYVNRGTGFWGPPMRVLSHAEITHFKFLKA